MYTFGIYVVCSLIQFLGAKQWNNLRNIKFNNCNIAKINMSVISKSYMDLVCSSYVTNKSYEFF